MSLGEILRSGIEASSVCRYAPGTSISLVESQNTMEVVVDAEKWQVTAIRLPENCHPKFVTGRDWRLLCDYFLVCERGDDVQVVFVELKMTLNASHEEKALEQLRRSLPLWRYLRCAVAVDSSSGETLSVPVRYAAIFLRADERFAKQRVSGADRVHSREWHGICVREVVATDLGLSELADFPADDAEKNR